ncbi:MAG: hypothetical protein A2X99_10910 [Deltaproteobacteria bacterium GWB2_55_19]|nr:MAG: hypothetical protein A2X99_10910 [Deltaproteobacteria bacterium GWB2_55_19]
MGSIKKFFNELTPKQKKLFVIAIIIILGGGLLFMGYKFRDGGIPMKTGVEQKKKISLDPGLLERAYSDNIKLELEKKDAELNAVRATVEELKKKVDEDERVKFQQWKEQSSGQGNTEKIVRNEPYPASGAGQQYQVQQPQGQQLPGGQPSRYPPLLSPPVGGSWGQSAPREEKPQPVGGIETTVGTKKDGKDGAAVQKDQLKKLAKRTVYLPPSFMEASLLTGFSAATMQSAKTYEKPLLLRVKDIAVLPNEIKTDLKGCFIMASAYGDLSDERAHARLVNLSCISKNGESVIDAPIKGFVVDSDGKIGLAGDVVTKMGALLGRSVLAGFFGGVGDAFKAASTTNSISSLGTTQTIDSNQIMQAGVGGGLSKGFGELQKFYLEMAKQTFPIVEVGSAKSVTVVIEQGVELEIKDYCVGGLDKKCSEKQD